MNTGGPLIDVTELAAAADGTRPVVLLDVRWRLAGPPPAELYAGGHLPGAVAVDLEEDLAAPAADRSRGRHPLPDPADLQAALRRWGIGGAGTVVAYDDADGSSAARAWWLLRWAGVAADRVAVLDGGWAAWAAGGPVTAEPSRPEPGDVVVRPGAMPVLDADGAAAVTGAGGVLVDARSGPRFRGETEPVDPVAGRIPGAVNMPATSIAEGRRWPSPDELRARLTALGLGAGRPEGAYCGSGVTAATVVLAAERAGLPVVPLYVGSWSDWCADPSRPVATGPDHLGSPA